VTKAVRGAILVRENEKRAIHEAGLRLIGQIVEANAMRPEDIVSIVFSLTRDLDAGNPATGLRQAGFAQTPLFCVQEAEVKGGMAAVMRALVTFEARKGSKTVAVYLDGAEALRPDITQGSTS
jgi:monofunctional chorismate mutase